MPKLFLDRGQTSERYSRRARVSVQSLRDPLQVRTYSCSNNTVRASTFPQFLAVVGGISSRASPSVGRSVRPPIGHFLTPFPSFCSVRFPHFHFFSYFHSPTFLLSPSLRRILTGEKEGGRGEGRRRPRPALVMHVWAERKPAHMGGGLETGLIHENPSFLGYGRSLARVCPGVLSRTSDDSSSLATLWSVGRRAGGRLVRRFRSWGSDHPSRPPDLA